MRPLCHKPSSTPPPPPLLPLTFCHHFFSIHRHWLHHLIFVQYWVVKQCRSMAIHNINIKFPFSIEMIMFPSISHAIIWTRVHVHVDELCCKAFKISHIGTNVWESRLTHYELIPLKAHCHWRLSMESCICSVPSSLDNVVVYACIRCLCFKRF